jgi:hypothetical protein
MIDYISIESHIYILFLIDADGELEHILPVCMDSKCSDSRIYVRDDNAVSLTIRIFC